MAKDDDWLFSTSTLLQTISEEVLIPSPYDPFDTSSTSYPVEPNAPDILRTIWRPDEGDVSELIFGLSQIIITILQCALIIGSLRTHQVLTHKNSSNKPHTLRLAIAIFIGYLISSILGIWQSIAWFLDEDEMASVLIEVHSVMTSLLVTSLYAFMAFRVHQTFCETIYRVPDCIFFVHGVNIAFVSVGTFFFATILLNDELPSWIKIAFIVLILVPFVVGLAHLIYMFNARLFALFILKLKVTDSASTDPLSASQRRLLSTVRKHTVLGSLIVIAQVVTMVHAVLLYGVIDLYSVTGYVSYWIICNLCIVIETVSLFAGFADNGRVYRRFCRCCDRGCDRICIDCVTEREAGNVNDGTAEMADVRSLSSTTTSSESMRTRMDVNGAGHIVPDTSMHMDTTADV